ncbi:MAG: bifunctional DNA-formamidopyrimidine glycosylase/DNA-(apurinic or apyrimidinic site) lyase [Acidobacteria bacterium]|nr:bifunctional DNA-formamidopyrimidine glycosylase/DNA-(apurinic or apyrimidinic site) lyase [Acidobacteriota bacterium]MBV9625178.1 bifunctional DNA-formamidopyrimidine glycosylase/DNA-(apurinic or apyrimidinic site) lyase [Acidobacteriota bacterium]
MPELPEVETIARGLATRLQGENIEAVWLGSKPEPLKSAAPEIAAALESKRIANVRRAGKHIVFDLVAAGEGEPRAQWIVHLGMTGRLLVCPPEAEVAKHTHAIVRLSSGRELRFIDPRRFGRLRVVNEFSIPGSEPLEIGQTDFAALFHGRRTPIKSALLNQKLLSGVGNIYADEALFRAGIRPRRRAASLTQSDLRRLRQALKRVLKQAIRLGGSTIASYVDADGQEGSFQLRHRVYGRGGEPCLVCKAVIRRVVVAGRSTHYCPKCQR